MNAHTEIKHLLPAWEAFRSATDIAPIRDEAHYQRMAAMLEGLLDEAAGNESHPAMGLVLLCHKSSFSLDLPQQGHCPSRAIN
jgi:HTH-type transcriptional regulator / antitoxin HigA